ncbi:MAG TPA: chromosomal replication initiator protein DnaA [Elusimicrobiota bacterium]|nr:chromosomal replication initiator protein DnaA [Elusimicrobiota bacterium]
MSTALDVDQLWSKTLSRMRQEAGDDQVELWLQPLQIAGLDGSSLRIKAPNSFFASAVRKNFHARLAAALSQEAARPLEIDYEVSCDVRVPSPAPTRPAEPPKPAFAGLNPRFTFESFVVGDSNRVARATLESIAKAPGIRFNPTFVHGAAGLGKTHLLQAAGNALRAAHPNFRVLYVTAEQFVNEYIVAVRQYRPEEFREKYRSLDCLLLDDVQFLTGKDRSQEEFFHTFNDLFHAKKQVVFASDCSPNELAAWDERMLSRMRGGVVAYLTAPGPDMRAEILRRKALELEMAMPEDVVRFLADLIKGNVRHLEGALLTLKACFAARAAELSIDGVREALKSALPPEEPVVEIETVLRVVAGKYNVEVGDLKGPKRAAPFVTPRQVAMYLCRQMTEASLEKIGAAFGGRDHSTVMHAHEKVRRQVEADPFIVELINKLRADVSQAQGR